MNLNDITTPGTGGWTRALITLDREVCRPLSYWPKKDRTNRAMVHRYFLNWIRRTGFNTEPLGNYADALDYVMGN